uniref:Uncharacterized protein n=1 Tax=Periophthalmus magnuspinnatus TaxID=409849 RepID=A0A3B3ZFB5_9GOBI
MQKANSTSAHPRLRQLTSTPHPSAPSDGNAFLYILIVLSFYGFFLSAIMFGYFHSKRKEKRRTNIFTKLVHDNEKREWGALPKKHSLTFSSPVPVGFCFIHTCFSQTENTLFHLVMSSCGNTGSASLHFKLHTSSRESYGRFQTWNFQTLLN